MSGLAVAVAGGRRGAGVRRRLKAVVAAAMMALASGTMVAALPTPAQAHGTPMSAGSRTWLCVKDGLTPQGNIVTINPACAEAQRTGGDTAYFNWFGHLQSAGAGRTVGFIPDGKLCSANNPTFSGFDLARDDWPVTHLTAGASIEFQYNNWAKHPGTFFQYVTKDTYDPNRALTWNDIEGASSTGPGTPFNSVTDPQQIGGPGTVDGHYFWTARLPSNKTGRHIIYTVWSRSDSTETFYSCSDVVFDGGTGQVTGVNRDANRNPIGTGPSSGPASPSGSVGPSSPGTSPSRSVGPSSPSASQSPRPSSSGPQPSRGCTATWKPIGAWNGNKYQVEITVRNTGTATTSGWSTVLSLGSPGTIDQMWGGTPSGTGTVTVTNVGYNGTISANATITFGFIANGTPPATTPSLPCTAA